MNNKNKFWNHNVKEIKKGIDEVIISIIKSIIYEE